MGCVSASVTTGLLAAVHRAVLERRAPELALSWPSVGGTGDAAQACPAVRALLSEETDHVRVDLARPCQTNEPGRAVALLAAPVARRTPDRSHPRAAAGGRCECRAQPAGRGVPAYGCQEADPDELRGIPTDVTTADDTQRIAVCSPHGPPVRLLAGA